MSDLLGIVVRLRTADSANAGTDDHIYIGVVGAGGGREFPLDSSIDDFEQGSNVKYWLGEVWDGTALVGAVKPYQSEPGGKNDPDGYRIELDKVQHVYIRKQGDPTPDGDDAYCFARVDVALYGSNPDRRTWSARDSLWLSNETGLSAWLPETLRSTAPGSTLDPRVDVH